ncbi:MAG: ATP12 family protein [Anderseniella sp.]
MSETEDERARRLLTARIDRNLPKRFYKQVAVGESDTGFEIQLDGRTVKTPLKRAFAVPSRDMAQAIATEWDAQETHIDPSTMIVTRLANTAVDRVRGDEQRIVDELRDFAGSDLVCYRAGTPDPLVGRQSLHWDPVLDWVKATHNVQFLCVEGIVHHTQPDTALAAICEALTAEDEFRLTAIHNVTTLTGSTLIAMMTAAGALTGEDAWAAAHADEDWQIEQWGGDEEAEARRAVRKQDFDATMQFLQMC